MPIGRVFDAEAAAKYLGVSQESIKRAARRGALKGYKDSLVLGSPWVFSKEDLDAYRESRKVRN